MLDRPLTGLLVASSALVAGIGAALADALPTPAPTPLPQPAALPLLAVGMGGAIVARRLYRRRRDR